jgi:diaminohydroxyphosphoribosylaminopyrimidine deaminase / 5-amino-6-(5-phosphoribosylamino)uracil reductase
VRITGSSAPSPRMNETALLERALELAERGRSTTAPNPVVGAVLVRDGEIVGEGWHERAGRPHAEIVALDAAGQRARGATLYVTLEPCAHHGRTPPCADALVAAGVTRVVAAVGDPNPETDGAGFDRLRAGGVTVELPGGDVEWRARVQNEAFRTWIARQRPFVTYKAAVTLDGRVTVPGSRWVTGEESRRRVHELRAQVDAVAVGMGTVRADDPQLTARGVAAERQPRRLAFGRRPLPVGSQLELVEGPLDEELTRLAGEGVQSLLLEGGPTLATSFLAEGLVDKLLLFIAPTLAGSGPRWLGELRHTVELLHVHGERVGVDYLVTAYTREP